MSADLSTGLARPLTFFFAEDVSSPCPTNFLNASVMSSFPIGFAMPVEEPLNGLSGDEASARLYDSEPGGAEVVRPTLRLSAAVAAGSEEESPAWFKTRSVSRFGGESIFAGS